MRGRANLKSWVAVCVFLLTMAQTVPGRTIYVDANGLADFNNIQAAIDDSNHGDVVIVNPGVYTGFGNRDISFRGKAITLRSTDPNNPSIVATTIIDCQGSKAEPHRGFYFYNQQGSDSILDGITITNGIGPYKRIDGLNYSRGGAIHCYDRSSPTIRNCIIKHNQARNGGAVENYWYCSPTIQNCIFMDNLAQDGHVSYGGAIYCGLGSRPKIVNSLFLRNRVGASHGDGGAIWSSNGGPVAINCNFISNRAEWGGAIASKTGSSKYINCIFWDNHRVTRGDDIANGVSGTITLQNCFLKCGLNWPCIYNNGTLIDEGGNTSGNPGFVDFANGNYHLLHNSPCVDAGTNEVTGDLPATDLSGEERIVDGNGDSIATVDIGAYEFFVPPIECPMRFTPQALNYASKGKWVKAHIVLPEEFGIEDVDTDSPAVVHPGGIESDYMNVFLNDDGLVEIEAAFDRADFCTIVTGPQPMEVRVVGWLTSGQQFYGTDTIKITNNFLMYLRTLASRWLEPGCASPDWCSGLDLNHDSMVNLLDLALFDGCCVEVMR